MKNRSIKSLSMILAVVLIAAFATLFTSTGTRVALADSGGKRGHIFDITFTKWVLPDTPPPDILALMAGVVGGDVGHGTFAGEVLQDNFDTAGIEHVVANYHINGAKHSFTAHLNVTQFGQMPGDKAAITGVVTDGWLRGKKVVGVYTVISCPDKPPLFQCFRGTLHIHVGAED